MDALWVFRSAASPDHMKNFVRLVKFALPYKVRFGLSVACAAMVAVLFFAELGTVYPLLHILFNSQDPQRWVSEKIVDLQADLRVIQARESEAQFVQDMATRETGTVAILGLRYQAIQNDFDANESALQGHKRRVGVTDPTERPDQSMSKELARLEGLHATVLEARSKELGDCGSFLKTGKPELLARRLRTIQQDASDTEKVLNRYRFVAAIRELSIYHMIVSKLCCC